MRTAARVLLALVVAPAALHAQDTPERPVNALEPGARALSFSLPSGGGGELGYWSMRSETTNLGLFLRFRAVHRSSDSQDSQGTSENRESELLVSLGPALRHYLRTRERVAPFVYGSAELGYSGHWAEGVVTTRVTNRSHNLFGGLGAGAGLEWFPVPEVSVSGQTGVQLSLSQLWTSNDAVGFPGTKNHGWTADLSTFTSALTLNVYLPRRRSLE